jgi:hypothetical protein
VALSLCVNSNRFHLLQNSLMVSVKEQARMLHIICPKDNVHSPAPDRRRGSWFGRLRVNPAEIKPTGIFKVHCSHAAAEAKLAFHCLRVPPDSHHMPTRLHHENRLARAHAACCAPPPMPCMPPCYCSYSFFLASEAAAR